MSRVPCHHTYSVERVSALPDLLALRGDSHTPSFYLEHPRSGEAVLGIGAAHVIRTSGTDRIGTAGRAVREALARTVPVAPLSCPDAPLPLFVGGFAFDAH
jgi:hypothetical protein